MVLEVLHSSISSRVDVNRMMGINKTTVVLHVIQSENKTPSGESLLLPHESINGHFFLSAITSDGNLCCC